jgi:DNA helicase-4
LKLKLTAPSSYRIGWLAALFASYSDYEAFSLADDGILLIRGKSTLSKISYLAISSDIAIRRGYFWDILIIHLEDGQLLKFGGVEKKQSKPLQMALNQHSLRYLNAFYQKIEPNLQLACQQARVLFSRQRYIRHAVARQWFSSYQHLAEKTRRRDVNRFLSAEALQNLQTIHTLLTQGYEGIAKCQ